jgi:hypothetical protein
VNLSFRLCAHKFSALTHRVSLRPH